MKKLVLFLIAVSFILAAIIIAIPVAASSAPPLPLDELVKKSDYIVIGTFTDKESYWEEVGQGRIIFTNFTLAVEKVIKGESKVEEITVVGGGGEVDGIRSYTTAGASITLNTRVIVFLTRYKEGDDRFYVMGANQGIQYLDSKWQYWEEGGRERYISSIVKIMVDNHIPVSLPLSEQFTYPVFATPRFITILLVALILLFGAIVLAVNRVRKRRNLPSLISDRDWNLVDWFWSVTWLLSLAFAIYVAVTITSLWWIGLIAVVIFGGVTTPLAVKRYIDRNKISQSRKRAE